MLMQLNGDYFAKATGKVETGDFLLWPAEKSDRIWRLFSKSNVSSATEERISDAEKAAAQIAGKKVFMTLQRLRYRKIMTYGIAFCQKTCVICQGKTDGT